MSALEVIIVSAQWYVALSLAGLALYPALFMVCRCLPDRGLTLVRPAGMAIAVLPLWSIGHISAVPLNAWTVLLILLLVGVPGWTVAVTRLHVLAWLGERWKWVLLAEAATVGLFACYVVFRGFNPDISGTEKPMELAFLNASMVSGEIPVHDPWFAGESINYYYLGYVALAAIAVISGVPGEMAFNLGLATVFATSTVAAAGLAGNLTTLIGGFDRVRILASGSIAGFFIAVAGNLHAARSFVSDPGGTVRESWWGGIGWRSSRIVEDTGFPDGDTRTVITEFPAFSWVLGDLHPHVIAYPWMIVALALVANLFIAANARNTQANLVTSALAVGVAIGVVYSSNTWDVPILALLAFLALLPTLRMADWYRSGVLVAGIAAGAFAAAGPFLLAYSSPTGATGKSAIPVAGSIVDSLGYVSWNRTSLGELMEHWGVFILALAVVSIWSGWRLIRDSRTHIVVLLAGSAGLVLLALVSGAPALALFGIPMFVLGSWLVQFRHSDDPAALPIATITVSLLVLCAIEFLFIRDPFGDRMNTVFKFSFQTWAILAIALAALIPLILTEIRDHFGRIAHVPAIAVLIAGVISTTVYTPISVYQWANQFNDWRGIDGIDYIERFHPDERAAIEWMQHTQEPIELVLEAPGCAYGSDNFMPHNRVSMATGYPTIIGWDGHQSQWRRGQPDLLHEIGARIQLASSLYEQPDSINWEVDGQPITHVYIGVHERQGYQQCGHGPPYGIPDEEELLELGWEMAFEGRSVTVYRLPQRDVPN